MFTTAGDPVTESWLDYLFSLIQPLKSHYYDLRSYITKKIDPCKKAKFIFPFAWYNSAAKKFWRGRVVGLARTLGKRVT
jgi:hypothetical protein